MYIKERKYSEQRMSNWRELALAGYFRVLDCCSNASLSMRGRSRSSAECRNPLFSGCNFLSSNL